MSPLDSFSLVGPSATTFGGRPAVSSHLFMCNPEEIRRRDPGFHGPVREGHQRWLGGPIKRYCHDTQSIEFSIRRDVNHPLAGSYRLQFIAQVNFSGHQSRDVHMWNVRRYDPQGLIRCLRGFGWDSVGVFPFSGSETRPSGLLMFQKQIPSSLDSGK